MSALNRASDNCWHGCTERNVEMGKRTNLKTRLAAQQSTRGLRIDLEENFERVRTMNTKPTKRTRTIKCVKQLVFSCTLTIVVLAGSVFASHNDKRQGHTLGPCVAVSNDLLRAYEPDYENFVGVEIADKIVYFQQRKIEEAIVQRDYILYRFDKRTQELQDMRINWRDDLPEELPQIIAKEQAQSMVEGEVRFSRLFYISGESDVFPIRPAPENPCWVIESFKQGRITVTVIDAVEGRIAGYGVPPPYTAFSLTGPINFEEEDCSDGWDGWYENARDWFNTMGYNTEAIRWPTEEETRNHIQSETTVMFYELAHGGSYGFTNACWDDTSADEIETWIADHYKMPFAFIGSCGGMCDTNDGTLSYELRKGSTENSATVGYCGMGGSPCAEECWYGDYTIPWQTALFNYMNQGWTVKAAFDQANAEYPACGVNGCMRFAGDEAFVVVPVVIGRGGKAHSPRPADKATDVTLNAILQWTAAVSADSHDVYLGTDFNDVSEANNSWPAGISVYKGNQPVGTTSYDPGGLEPHTTYYWRIDEFDDPCVSKGNVWSFTSGNYIVVDDMESYNNTNNKIWDTWIDGWENATGSVLVLGIDPCDPVHGGKQSMMFFYNNDSFSALYKYSEVYRTFSDPRDWTVLGVKVLTLYFYGDPGNDANETEQMYVGLEDSTGAGSYAELRYGDNDEDMNDIKEDQWHEWNIALMDFTGVDANDVNKVYIGFGDRDHPVAGGLGTVYFDDLRLYAHRCILPGPYADINADCVVDHKDLKIMAEQWLDNGSLTADLCEDDMVNFKDFTVLAGDWLDENLWP